MNLNINNISSLNGRDCILFHFYQEQMNIKYAGDFEEIKRNNRMFYYANYKHNEYQTFVAYELS